MLECFEHGLLEPEIVELFSGDSQLVGMWRAFLIHNHWMFNDGNTWVITDKGREWMEKISKQQPSVV